MRHSHQIVGPQVWLPHVPANGIRASGPGFVTVLLFCAGGVMLPACRGSQVPSNSNAGPPAIRRSTFTTPPFSTKEPDRYQAIRITSFTETGNNENSSSSRSNRVLIARDGEKRREEYSAGTSGEIVYLEIPSGRFIVLPASRMYADLSSASGENDPDRTSDDSPELSADYLLNEPHAPATYETLGTESLAGRTTTKYRVVVLDGTASPSETFIWVDEVLGIPVRSETMSKFNGHSSKVTMELMNVKLEVDERSFSWPSDYKKVEAQVILSQIGKNEKPATPKQDKK